MRALERAGWRPENPPAADEAAIYRHSAKPGRRVPVDPDWAVVNRNGAIFECLCADTGMSERRLLGLLSGHQ